MEIGYRRTKTVKSMKGKELARQSMHMFAGILLMTILVYYGRINLIAFSLLLLIGGSLLINFKLVGKHVPIAHDIGDALERTEVRFPGWGAAWYVFGIMLLATVLEDDNKLLTAIFILGISDGLATIAGVWGTHRLPYNKKKTAEGSAAFLASALLTYGLIGIKAVPLAIIAAIIESTDLRLDDNFSLPIISAAYLLLV